MIEVLWLIVKALAILSAIMLFNMKAQGQVGSFNTAADLRNQVGTNGYQALTNGRNTMFDNNSGVYVYCDTCTDVDDSINVLKPLYTTIGRWKKLKFGTATVKGLADSLAMLRWERDSVDAINNVNSDWNAISGKASILNKPTLNLSNWNAAYGWGNHAVAGYLTSSSLTPYSTTSTNDGKYVSLLGSYTNPSWLVSIPNTKITYTGNTTQYIRGDGSLATFPSIGSVTNISTGYGLTGGPITTTGTLTADTTSASGLVSKLRLNSMLSSYATTSQASYTQGTGIAIASNVITNTAPDQVVSLTTTGYGITKSGTYPNFTITANTPTYNNTPTVTLNTSAKLSATNNVRVSYTVQSAVQLTLVVGSGSVQTYLEISPDNSTWTTINSVGLNETLSVAVATTRTQQQNISGEVPANYYRRLRTVATQSILQAGTTVTYLNGQEVTY